jgi:hypothetical protein
MGYAVNVSIQVHFLIMEGKTIGQFNFNILANTQLETIVLLNGKPRDERMVDCEKVIDRVCDGKSGGHTDLRRLQWRNKVE